jgi:DNA-binding LacI/PurR family transcriptional regulator
MAVIGFDDNDMGALVTPALTSLHIDADVHGRRAARGVLGLDASDLAPDSGRIVERESV